MHRIILSGIKHSGKSTVGWNLSSRLGVYFADLDDLILRDAKEFQSVREIYRKLGKEGFMKLEKKSLAHFLKANRRKSFILSLGGGIIENTEAIQLLNGKGKVCFLDAESDDLYKRIIKGGIPPFLEGDDPLSAFNKMYKRRTELYNHWAEFVIDTRGLTPSEVTDKVESEVKNITQADQTK